jgi:hypothetical protein
MITGQASGSSRQRGQPAHPHAACGLHECFVNAGEAHHDVSQDREETEEHQNDHRRIDTHPDEADQNAKKRVGRDRQADGCEGVADGNAPW